MEFKELKLKGAFEISSQPKSDGRGFFMRTYDLKEFSGSGLHKSWVQENQSLSKKKGTIRGLHFQLPPFSETKLIRCVRGSIFDVLVDLREDSETFGGWTGMEISEHNFKSLLIPRGFAHGFCTLTDECEVQYKVDNYYTPSSECGIIWNDPELNINWPVHDPIISTKDSGLMTFKAYREKYYAIHW